MSHYKHGNIKKLKHHRPCFKKNWLQNPNDIETLRDFAYLCSTIIDQLASYKT